MKIIVVGTSAGGVEALQVIARGLPGDLPAAILIVMHCSPQGPYLLPSILSAAGPVAVAAAVDGALIESGKIYIAPPDHHMLVEGNRLCLSKGPKENRSRPAIDPLFRTAAATYGSSVIGVILTGGLDDGTAGLSAVKESGGTTIVQDPADALYPSMPTSALKYVEADHTLPLVKIAPLLALLAKRPIETSGFLPVSHLNAIEANFAQMKAMPMKDMDVIGSHAGLSCPECHGPMWKIHDGKLLRYRCHVGHAYTAQAMAEGQIEAQETHLWQALRLMKERVSLILEMRCHAENDNRSSDAETARAKIKQLQNNIAQVQAMLDDNDPVAAEAPEAKRVGP